MKASLLFSAGGVGLLYLLVGSLPLAAMPHVPEKETLGAQELTKIQAEISLNTTVENQAEIPETDWLDLMPKSDQKALEAMPDIDHNSPEAQGTFDSKGGLKQSKGLPAVMY
ncbi:MAG: hypothetical protein ACMG55_10370, partial [Microcoleus sp.]